MFASIYRVAPAIACVCLMVQRPLAADSASVVPPDPIRIDYQVSALGGIRWQYTYDVANNSSTQPLSQFTIWFNDALYRNLAIATPNPPAANWSELVAQPDPVFQFDGFYDALSLTGGIVAGEHVSGFRVAFDWLGAGQPGAQPFEIIDPGNSQTLYSNLTAPEPASVMLLLAAALCSGRSVFGRQRQSALIHIEGGPAIG